MIEIQGVSKSFDHMPVLDQINLSIRRKETLVIIGPSGSGKTTLLKLLNKLYVPDKGRILIDQKDIQSLDTIGLRRRMGYVVQEVGLFPHLSLYDNIALIPRIMEWDEKVITEKIEELKLLLNIEDIDLRSKNMHEISGGQRQRIGIARALITDPEIILLDEPFGALDPVTRLYVRKEFRKLEDLIKKTMVMVTHDITEALEIGDRICVLHEGRVQQVDTPKRLLFNPANTFVSDFFQNDLFKHQMQQVSIQEIQSILEEGTQKTSDATEVDSEQTIFSLFNEQLHQKKNFCLILEDKRKIFFTADDLMKAFLTYITKIQH